MHRFRFVCLVLLTVSVGIVAGQDALPASSPYYPLTVGNTWHYRAGESRFALKVTGIEKVGNTPCARIDLLVNDKSHTHELISVTKDEVLRYRYQNNDAKPPIPFLKSTPKVGDTWKVDAKVGDQPLKGTFKVGEAKDVKVPAGTYNTITVTGTDMEANGVKLSIEYYFVEKVGMVKQVLDVAGQKVVIELEKFEGK